MAHAAFVAARGAGHAIDGVAASNLVRGHAAAGELAAALEVLEYVPPAGLDVRSLAKSVLRAEEHGVLPERVGALVASMQVGTAAAQPGAYDAVADAVWASWGADY